MHHHLPETKKQGRSSSFVLKKGERMEKCYNRFFFVHPSGRLSLLNFQNGRTSLLLYLFIIGFYLEFINKICFVTLPTKSL